MLASGMKNKNIQFFFNRPDRPVNSGRITGISNGTYAKSKDIPAASQKALNEFISKTEKVAESREIQSGKAFGPVHSNTLAAMFKQDKDGVWRFVAGETDQHECKKSFGFKHSGQWLKAIAALANNRGGYVLFGVHDKLETLQDGIDHSYAAVGLEDDVFEKADPEKFAKLIKSSLDPTPRVQFASLKVGGKTIGFIHVEQHPSRPVIVTRPEGDKMREGDIFFRYPGQSDRIKYSDLRALLDARDRQARQDMMPMLEKLLSLGPERALIADISKGTLGDGRSEIVIDPRLAEQLHFIKEGEFSERNGEPTLKLIGEVKKFDGTISVGERIVLNAIREDDILRNFTRQLNVDHPESYILANLDHQRKWLPVFYYVHLSGKSPDEMTAIIAAEKTTHPSKRRDLVERLSGKLSAKGKPTTQSEKAIVEEISRGIIQTPTNLKQVAQLARAVMSLEKQPGDIHRILAVIERAMSIAEEDPTSGAVGEICRAVCRLDELYFGTRTPKS
jgi:hypothetical protein